MKQRMITAACLVAALLCYAAGFGGGVVAFAAAGLVLECVFGVAYSSVVRLPETA